MSEVCPTRIRHAQLSDVPSLSRLESQCFPASEAADEQTLRERVTVFPDRFWLLFRGDTLVSFVNGLLTDERDLTDVMYENPALHRKDGSWQMIFGVDTHPDFRRNGYAGQLLHTVQAQVREEGRSGIVLTCKPALIPYYASFGFRSEGISASVHGGVLWYSMRWIADR